MTVLAVNDGFVNMPYLIESSVLKGYFSNVDECDISSSNLLVSLSL